MIQNAAIDEQAASNCTSCSRKHSTAVSGPQRRDYRHPDLAAATSSIPVPFAVWRARFLFGQELLCCFVIFLATYYIFLHMTRPALCRAGPAAGRFADGQTASEGLNTPGLRDQHMHLGQNSHISSSCPSSGDSSNPKECPVLTDPQAAAAAAASNAWPMIWQLLCYDLSSSSSGSRETVYQALPGFSIVQSLEAFVRHECTVVNARSYASTLSPAAPAAAAVAAAAAVRCAAAKVLLPVAFAARGAFLSLAQFLALWFGWGWFINDYVAILAPFLRLSITSLLLLPVPIPNVAAAAAAIWSKFIYRRPTAGSSSSSRVLVHWYTPNYYWQHPKLRYFVVISQRLGIHIAAAATVGLVSSTYLGVSSLKFWCGGMCMYTGWIAFLLVLPFKLHLLVSIMEWLLLYSTAVRVHTTYHQPCSSSSSSSSSSSWISSPDLIRYNPISHLVVSLLFVVVLPGIGIWWLEQSHWERYQQYIAAAAAASRSSSGSSSPCRSKCMEIDGNVDGHAGDNCAAAAAAAAARFSSSSDDSAGSNQLVKDIKASLKLAAAAAAADALPDQDLDLLGDSSSSSTRRFKVQDIPDHLQFAAAAATAASGSASRRIADGSSSSSSSSSVESMRRLVPALQGLLPDDDVAEVFQIAAARASQLPPGRVGVWEYKSVAATLPVTVKVHSAPHTAVQTLEPVLTGALEYQLAAAAAAVQGPSSSGSSSLIRSTSDPALLQMHAICFPGCVQMLAAVYGPRQLVAAAMRESSSSSSSSSESSLIRLISSSLGRDSRSRDLSHDLSGGPPHVSVSKGTLNWNTVSSSSDCCQIDSVHGDGSTSSDTLPGDPYCRMEIRCVEPCCLVAADSSNNCDSAQQQQQQQEVIITYQIVQGFSTTGSNNSRSDHTNSPSLDCRLLVFQPGRVLTDQRVVLDQAGSGGSSGSRLGIFRVAVPDSFAAVVHIALLPQDPTPLQQQQQQTDIPGTEINPSSARIAPLLLLPMLVLPAAAAQELDDLRQSMQAAAAADNRSQITASEAVAAAAAAAWQFVNALTVDLAYLLSVAAVQPPAAAAAAAARSDRQQQQYPPQMIRDLAAVCKQLASCGLCNIMEFLLQQLTPQSGTTRHTPMAPTARSAEGFDTAPTAAGFNTNSTAERFGTAPTERLHPASLVPRTVFGFACPSSDGLSRTGAVGRSSGGIGPACKDTTSAAVSEVCKETWTDQLRKDTDDGRHKDTGNSRYCQGTQSAVGQLYKDTTSLICKDIIRSAIDIPGRKSRAKSDGVTYNMYGLLGPAATATIAALDIIVPERYSQSI